MANTVEAQSLSRTSGGGDVESALLSYSQLLHQDLSRNRFAEEREWYEDALFYQRRQWLKWDASNKRWSLVKQNPDKPRPMPVTNHYARTINAVANQLSSGAPKVGATPLDDSDANRRAAESAEKACKAIDKESDAKIMWPLLGKHTTLWGMGITKDFWDSTRSNGTVRIPQIEVQSSQQLGCLDCGSVTDISGDMAANPGAPAPTEQQAPCPNCGSPQTVGWTQNDPVTTSVKEFSKGRICTEVRPPFEVFVPRDCQNPNLAPKIQQVYRKPLQVAKRLWPDETKDIKADSKTEVHQIYLEALRSLVNYNYMHDQTAESVTITETWADYDQLPEELQQLLLTEVESGDKGLDNGGSDDGNGSGEANGKGAGSLSSLTTSAKEGAPGMEGSGQADPEQAPGEDGDEEEVLEAPDPELPPCEQLKQWGIFIIEGGGKILDWGINNLEGKKPFTFYLWEVDPANVYPKGLGVDLVPLQKRLNRLDSLMELGIMSNAAGKWLWPTTQTTKPPTGSPSDVVEFDPIGDGKIAPTFVQPSPFHAACFSLRQAILTDFEIIGMTNGIQQGTNPEGQTSFRGIAYLGAKAAEQISTQRFLWETAHQLRYEKCLILARKNWTDDRKVKVAGFNGKWGMQTLMGKDLEGEYLVEIEPDSSRPQSLAEKEQSFQMLVEGGLVDITDSETREYVIDLMNLDNVNLVGHLQYLKAERDLDAVIAGNIPPVNPYIDIGIYFKIFTSFTLTEEFEGLPQDGQERVLMACEMISQAQAAQQAQMMAAMMPPPGVPPANQKLAGAMQKKNGQKGPSAGLNGVPGGNTTPEQSSEAALGEGQNLASQIP